MYLCASSINGLLQFCLLVSLWCLCALVILNGGIEYRFDMEILHFKQCWAIAYNWCKIHKTLIRNSNLWSVCLLLPLTTLLDFSIYFRYSKVLWVQCLKLQHICVAYNILGIVAALVLLLLLFYSITLFHCTYSLLAQCFLADCAVQWLLVVVVLTQRRCSTCRNQWGRRVHRVL